MLQQRKANCIRHTACESCGSSDANAEYDDGTYFCFSCNTYTPATRKQQERIMEVSLTKDAELERLIAKWAAAPATSIPERNITSTYTKHYGVVVDDGKHYYPYFSDESSEPVGFKVRHVATKGFVSIGNTKDAGLFGQQRYGNHNQRW